MKAQSLNLVLCQTGEEDEEEGVESITIPLVQPRRSSIAGRLSHKGTHPLDTSMCRVLKCVITSHLNCLRNLRWFRRADESGALNPDGH